MSKADQNTNTEKIPSITLNGEVLKEICHILDRTCVEESGHGNQPRLLYTITEKGKQKVRHDSESFLRIPISSDLNRIDMKLESGDKIVKVIFDMGTLFSESEIEVRGNDSNWIDDMTSRIKYALHKHRNFNWVLRGIGAVSIGIFIGIIISYVIVTQTGLHILPSVIGMYVLVTFMTSFLLYLLFQWLFPKIETGLRIQNKIRDKGRWVIGTIVSSIISFLVGRFLQ